MSPLCLGIGVQFHNNFQSKIGVDELNALGISVCYNTVTNYIHASAVALSKALYNMLIHQYNSLRTMLTIILEP